MKYLVTDEARCTCDHLGQVSVVATQDFVTIGGHFMLVAGDFDGRPISLCMGGAEIVGVTRCRRIISTNATSSHSDFVTVNGLGVTLASATGNTDYMNVGTARWATQSPGQEWVSIVENGT